MAPNQPPPLPLAADRAALSNRLSMLISNRSSLLKSLNTSSSSTAAEKPPRRHAQPDDEDLWTGTQLNEGVGHVAQKPTADKKKEDQMLRGRLLGKRKVGRATTRSGLAESESDEEEGRGSLGKSKRKRPRRTEMETEHKEREVTDLDQIIEEGHQGGGLKGTAAETGTDSVMEAQEGIAQVQAGTAKKKNKRRKKNKSKGTGESSNTV